MKIESKFKEKKNSLYTIDNKAVSVIEMAHFKINESSISSDSLLRTVLMERICGTTEKPVILTISWKCVEPQEESYNEEFLALLRNFLKKLEAENIYTVIDPIPEIDFTPKLFTSFTAAVVHLARRIKDCSNVIGFTIHPSINETSNINFYKEELSRKHSQYLYFTKNKISEANEKIIFY